MTRGSISRVSPKFDVRVPPRQMIPVTVLDAASEALLRSNSSSAFTATKIMENLYLGSSSDVASLEELDSRKIRWILNTAAECEIPPVILSQSDKYHTLHLKLRDHSDEDIARCFDAAIHFIHEARQRQEGCLVHCRMGVSRSATFVMAYMMEHGKMGAAGSGYMSYDEVFAYVKTRRQEVSPNIGFAMALRQLDVTHGFRLSVYDDSPVVASSTWLSPEDESQQSDGSSFRGLHSIGASPLISTNPPQFISSSDAGINGDGSPKTSSSGTKVFFDDPEQQLSSQRSHDDVKRLTTPKQEPTKVCC